MSHREDNKVAEARQAWTAPAVRRMSAGSAEDGAEDIFDGAQPS
jgi:hypothetical protein